MKPSATSAPRPAESGFTAGLSDGAQYALGIAVLAVALVVSSLMGLWQEGTYKRYGAVWQEGLFYSVRRSRYTVVHTLIRSCAPTARSFPSILPPLPLQPHTRLYPPLPIPTDASPPPASGVGSADKVLLYRWKRHRTWTRARRSLGLDRVGA